MSDELISQNHIDRLTRLYQRDDNGAQNFGRIGHLWAPRIVEMLREVEARSYLDYGCGKSGLAARVQELAPDVVTQEYDPVTAPGTPNPADFVSCIDVLEHVEADKIDNVLRDIKRCNTRVALITISLRNASPKKRLTHPLVRPRKWWIAKIQLEVGNATEIPILDSDKATSEIAMLVRPHETADLS